MKTPKQYAEELVNRYMQADINELDSWLSRPATIRIAQIDVQNSINALSKQPILHSPTFTYYKQVLTELENF